MQVSKWIVVKLFGMLGLLSCLSGFAVAHPGHGEQLAQADSPLHALLHWEYHAILLLLMMLAAIHVSRWFRLASIVPAGIDRRR